MPPFQPRRPRYDQVAHPEPSEGRDSGIPNVVFRVILYCVAIPAVVTFLTFSIMPTITESLAILRALVSAPLSEPGRAAVLFFGPIVCGGIAFLLGLIDVIAKGNQ